MASAKGGDKFEAVLKDMAKRLGNGTAVRVGVLEGSTYPDGTPTALIAALNEFGVPARKQPPRPFFRSMIAEKSPGWGDALGKLLVANGYDARRSLAQMGEGVAGQLRESIATFTTPPLSPVTVARKGFAKPLIDSGHLLASVSYEVED